MSLKEMLLTFEVWQVVLANDLMLLADTETALFLINPEELGDVQAKGHEEHDHSEGREELHHQLLL